MSQPRPSWTDDQVEQLLGTLLRVGVLIAALVVLIGGVRYLSRYGSEPIDPRAAFIASAVGQAGGLPHLWQADWTAVTLLRPDYSVFHGEPGNLRSPAEIVWGAVTLRRRALIQLGLLLLIATPVARVIFSVYAFLRQRDYTYVVLTLIVLAVLLFSLFFHP